MTKTAFITGASRGIGRGIALQLAKSGYDIAFTYHTELDMAKSLKEKISQFGQRCFFYQANLEEADVSKNVTTKAIKDLKHLDVLICNAGVTEFTSIKTLDIKTIDYTYRLNYRSYLLCTKVAVNHMIEQGIQGRILYTSSTRGIRAYPNDAVYGSLKAALNRLVQSLAIELAEHKITVNAVAPGATANRNDYSDAELKQGHISTLVPLKRRGKPADIAALVNYLISPAAEYITGETIRVDGGLILYGPDEHHN